MGVSVTLPQELASLCQTTLYTECVLNKMASACTSSSLDGLHVVEPLKRRAKVKRDAGPCAPCAAAASTTASARDVHRC